ncbi:alpha/beta-hydrolase [Trichodelitschia bisporula]|uniref:Alpha/beta-hydrolase n=1 Tax=Trichodelitschia bisporula TaxID=703511 RepID=A0A6G1HM88_9PEZI|nr:alpha/beta-hydrolase [Trichodelitschia bisporula]
MPLQAYQPFKALYTLIAVAFETARFPFWILLYIHTAGRPHRKWTLRQAIRMRIVKAFLYHSSKVRVAPQLSLAPGTEKERFVVMEPATNSLYTGPTKDSEIVPTAIGGTWTPAAPTDVSNLEVVLHFHGGAYVIGDGRDRDTGFLARTLIKHAQATHVFTPQYRLSSSAQGQFPAALQDAITSYSYLVRTVGVPPSRITVSGDSAGGNLTIALLRYIEEHGADTGLPSPGCVWLWSPWTNIAAGLDAHEMESSPNYSTDYLNSEFGSWGAHTFTAGKDALQPYVTAYGNPFACKTPIWVQTGDAEILYEEDTEFVQQMESVKGNKIELFVSEAMPHDIILVGRILGFETEAAAAAKKAGEFLRAERAHL